MKTKMLIASLIVLVFCFSSLAHQDRIFLLKGETLEGLPAKYQPATFSYETKTLTIKHCSIIFPENIWKRYGDTGVNPLEFSGSWYHSKFSSGLSPYISLSNTNFFLLLNLNNLSVITKWGFSDLSEGEHAEWNESRKFGIGFYFKKLLYFLPLALLIVFIIKKRNPNQRTHSITASGGSE